MCAYVRGSFKCHKSRAVWHIDEVSKEASCNGGHFGYFADNHNSIGSCWIFGFIICIVIAACINPDIESVLGTAYGQPMAQIYFDAVGKKGALGLMSLLFIVQFFMGLSILVAVSRQSWVCYFALNLLLPPSPAANYDQ